MPFPRPSITSRAITTPRIAPLDPPYAAELQAAFDTVMRGAPPLSLFRTVARNPRVLARFFAGGLLDKGSISVRLRELMILRTTALCGAEYEWGVHVATFGEKAGWTDAELGATVHSTADAGCWSADERAVIELADRLHASAGVDDDTWRRASAHFAAEQLVELVMLAGNYRTVSSLVNAFALSREAFAPAFPPAPEGHR